MSLTDHLQCKFVSSIYLSPGKSWSDKVNDVRAKMKAKQATGVVFHKLDDEACKYESLTCDHP